MKKNSRYEFLLLITLLYINRKGLELYIDHLANF
jgi:hypothetical protein